MKKNILICTERLRIGGVETVVYNEAIALNKKGYNIYVLSDDGEYRKELEQRGAKWFHYKFAVKNTFDTNDIEQIENFIKTNKIEEIHIHATVCIPVMLMICSRVNVPYVVYIHDAFPESYDWFINNYNIYDLALKLFYENSSKIICITENVKKYHKKRFQIDEEKYLVIKNSINFDIYKCENELQKKLPENFLIVSRIASEKWNSILNAIEVFKNYSNKVDFKTKLTIIGDGDKKQELIKILEGEKYDIEYKGATNEVNKIINENDVVFGLGRCIVEALATKRIAIISGYEHEKGIVRPEKLEIALEENLSGRNLEDITIEDQANELLSLDKQLIEHITEKNYQIIKQKLDIEKNVYVLPEDTKTTTFNYNSLYSEINKMSQKIEEFKQKSDDIWRERIYFEKQCEYKEKEKAYFEEQYIHEQIEKRYLEAQLREKQTYIENLIDEKNQILAENEKQREELINIKNGRIYKIISKITNKNAK